MLEFYGFLFISIIGSILHFTYNLSKQNIYVSLFSSVNESVWEHMKLVVFPSLIWLLFEIPFIGNNANFLVAKCVSLVVMISLIPLLFYLYTFIFKKSVLIVDILIFYIAVGVGQYLSYLLLKSNGISNVLNYISLVIMILVYSYFLVATLIPGKSKLYLDPITKKKGIFGNKKFK